MLNELITKRDAIEAVEQAIINHDSAITRIVELPPIKIAWKEETETSNND